MPFKNLICFLYFPMLPLSREFSGNLWWNVYQTLRTCRRRKLLQNDNYYYRLLIQYTASNIIFSRYPSCSYFPDLPALKGLTEILGEKDKIFLHFYSSSPTTDIHCVSDVFHQRITDRSISEILHWVFFFCSTLKKQKKHCKILLAPQGGEPWASIWQAEIESV